MAGDARLKKKLGKGRHASAIKRQRQTEKRTARNKRERSKTKTAVKKVRTAITEKNKAASQTALRSAISALAKAATKGVIPKQRASRLASRLSKAVNLLS